MEPNEKTLVEAEANPEVGVILDVPHVGAPLIIAFGFVDWEAPGRFDFARRLRKLERTTGQKLNLILVRDTANLWYQHGVPGLGPDVHATAATLQQLVANLKPKSLGTIGQSMGGYAAILFGTLLNANHVLAFGPLSYLRSDWARRDDDSRWLSIMETLERFRPAPFYDDLPALLATSAHSPSIRILYGTGPEPSGPANRDDLHARRYAACPAASVETIPASGHAVVKWLIDHGHIDEVVRRNLIDPLANEATIWRGPGAIPHSGTVAAFQPWDDDRRTWIAEHLALGQTQAALMASLVEMGFHPGEARREIYKAVRSPYHVPLARLLERKQQAPEVSRGNSDPASGLGQRQSVEPE